jgi:capsular polysaccharide transport system permease protein
MLFKSLAPVPQLPKTAPHRFATSRAIVALMLREMSTTYGRSALGYLWAILEPIAGILLLTFVFSLAFKSPAIGTSFALFYASGYLPFLAYLDISQKTSVALRFSKALLFYPRVTFLDAIAARFLTNALTQTIVVFAVLGAIVIFEQIDLLFDPMAFFHGFAMALALAAGIGTLNCFLLSSYPIWERAWAVLNRPLFVISGVIFIPDSLPEPYQSWLMWNPLVHIIGQVRSGIYTTYDATYVQPLFVYSVALISLTVGLLLLRRYSSEIVNF